MGTLVYSQEALQLDRPMVLVPLEEYESLLLAAVRSRAPRQESVGTRGRKKLVKLLEKIHQEKGRIFKSTRAFRRYLKDL